MPRTAKRIPETATLQWPGKSLHPADPVDLRQTDLVLPTGGGSVAHPNRLILGDSLGVMAALLAQFEGQVDLIYADPPFHSGKTYRARTGRSEDSRRPSAWQTTTGFEDAWSGLPEYLNMLYPRLVLMHRLLAETGTLYLHLDWHAAAYGRVLLDEIFGPDRLLNEIIWVYHGPSPIRSGFKRKHDTIYVYTKSKAYTFNADAVRTPYDPATAKTFASSPKAGFGKRPDLARGKVPEDWWYFPVVARLHAERTGYPTQKPEALLERVVAASTQSGALVADFFCGAGTTAVVADRLERRWLACDLSPLAVGTTRRRLLLQPATQAFGVWEDPSVPGGPALKPRVRVGATGRDVRVSLIGIGDSDSESLTGFEVDWDYDGRLFRSRSQSVRGWRSAEFIPSLSNHYRRRGRHTVAAKAMTAQGGVGWLAKEIKLS
ncbi:MAG TPA: site-specific DNA-methyltransferase [Anaerolineales bacterium]